MYLLLEHKSHSDRGLSFQLHCFQKGQDKEQRKTADRLLDRGFSLEEVAELTDLSGDEVRKIAAERNQE